MITAQQSDWFEAEVEKARRRFIEDCTFAKVVTLPDGRDGLLIAGNVIEVRSNVRHHAQWLAAALRERTVSDSNLTAGQQSAGALGGKP